MIDAWNEKSSWNVPSSMENSFSNKCPLPKFRIDNDSAVLMATYLSTGLTNRRQVSDTSMTKTNGQNPVCGSFHTSIADHTTAISPSPLLFNVHFDFNKLSTISNNNN